MHSHSIEPFADNWAYLKTELTWLDRVLSMAIARQRQETKVVDRVARSRVDRVTSHWWKGLVTLEGETAYDSPAQYPSRQTITPKASYQQQLEAKIKVSQQRGIALGLPLLCRRLQLSTAEKNLLLIALAPEISRRYARFYNYLQETEYPGATGLPTVDLILRLLCRTDADWRSLRHCLTDDSALIQHQLLELRSSQSAPLLARLVKLPDPLVNYLLADRPDTASLETLLHPALLPLLPPLPLRPPPLPLPPHQDPWTTLILPPSLLADLQHLCHRVQFAQKVDEDWGFAATCGSSPMLSTESIALLVGAPGTGKTLAAQAIAHTLQTPLMQIDVSQQSLDDVPALLHAIATQAPTVLLLQAADCWLSRTSLLSRSVLHQFFAARRQQGITLLSVHHKQSVSIYWRQHLNAILEFPLPNQTARLQLWQQAFPASVPLDAAIDWTRLAQQLPLTGGEIRTIARDAAIHAAASDTHLTTQHLLQAYERLKGKQGRGRKF